MSTRTGTGTGVSVLILVPAGACETISLVAGDCRTRRPREYAGRATVKEAGADEGAQG